MKDWFEAGSKPLALVSAVVAVIAALVWHLSANAQEALNLATNTNSEAFKTALSMSLKLNSQAAILSAVSAALAALSVLASK
ncbi:hypothetical protein [Pseudomonas sp. OA65]|uniref:hypothetical protein n=1 Tax=Pseudomonas sp. OA65 TaxID=2818431 RepID=UPI001A9DEB5A|nr:hypothetical protein [Pseudomonas sp. OA65]MBO1539936.1 hypothetical protein [Pseudomonas sp. OA65]